MDAYRALRGWVRSVQAPSEPPPELPACSGASVVLMLDGKVIGRASRMGEGDSGEPLWRAARGALAQANAARADLRERAPDIRISLELASPLIPLTDDELRAPALTLSPGIDGVAVRRADRLRGAFPGEILRRNTDAARAIVALVGEIAGDATAGLEPLATLKDRGYVFYRFRASHIAQPAPHEAAIFLQRAGRPFPRSGMTFAEINRLADALAERLAGSMWPGVEPMGVTGAYDPLLDRQIEPHASPLEQALVALALTKYAQARAPGERRSEALRCARQILEDLAVVTGGELDPAQDLGASAAAIVALAAYQRADPASLRSNERLRRLLALWDTLAGAREGGAFREDVPGGALGLLACAAVSARALGLPVENDPPEAWVVEAYRRTPPELLVGQMPWLGWASVELAGDGAVDAAEALRLMRQLVWEHQLGLSDLDPWNEDLAGGIVFTKGPNPLPTWQALRPLACIATMLRRPSLTPGTLEGGEVPGELARLLDSLRFVRELAADRADGHMYAHPARAIDGVRNALWDQTMTPGASAMALMTLSETILSLRHELDELGEFRE